MFAVSCSEKQHHELSWKFSLCLWAGELLIQNKKTNYIYIYKYIHTFRSLYSVRLFQEVEYFTKNLINRVYTD